MTAAATSLWQRMWFTRWRDLLRGQVDGRLNWRQVIAAEDLPANVRGLIGEVVGGTRLWRSEKVEVAHDLIAHFQDGLAAGDSPEQLIESFGNPRQAARLIRRAKRRGRSPLWRVWHWACLAFGAFFVAYVALGLYYITGRPTIKVDYVAYINERAKSAPDAERAWPLYRQALGRLMLDRKFPEWMDDATFSPSSKKWPDAVAWLKEHEVALATLREATRRPELGFAVGTSPKAFLPADQRLLFDPGDVRLAPQAPKNDRLEDQLVISTHLPHLIVLRDAARLLAFDAQSAALAGDGVTALADVQAMLGIANHVQQMPCLVVTVTAAKIQQLAYSAVEDILSQRPDLWSAEQMRDLAHAIAANRIDWRRGFDGEHALFLDTMQRFYTDNGRGDGHLVFRGPEGLNVFDALSRFSGGGPNNAFAHDVLAAALMPAANMCIASRKEMTDLYEALINEAMTKVETPLWKSLPEHEHSADVDLAKLGPVSLMDARHVFVTLMIPAYDRLRKNVAAWDGERDGVLAGIALELYHRQHEAWPESLDELSPRWLPAVPVDPMTGRPLGYKIVNDRPLVYSVGGDRNDDGGRRPVADGVTQSEEMAAPNAEPMPLDGDWVIWTTSPKE